MSYYGVQIIKKKQYGAQDGVQNGSPKPDFSFKAIIGPIIALLKYTRDYSEVTVLML